jgi:hypothetical protein
MVNFTLLKVIFRRFTDRINFLFVKAYHILINFPIQLLNIHSNPFLEDG